MEPADNIMDNNLEGDLEPEMDVIVDDELNNINDGFDDLTDTLSKAQMQINAIKKQMRVVCLKRRVIGKDGQVKVYEYRQEMEIKQQRGEFTPDQIRMMIEGATQGVTSKKISMKIAMPYQKVNKWIRKWMAEKIQTPEVRAAEKELDRELMK